MELAVVLGIAGAVVGAIWAVGTMVQTRAETTNAISQLKTVSQNMADFGSSGYGNGLAAATNITAAMINVGVIPDWLVSSATPTQAGSPWNSTGFNVWWMGSSPKIFRLTFYNVPTHGACLSLIKDGIVCTSQKSGCVKAVYTQNAAQTLASSLVTTTTADVLCGFNSYNGSGPNSVEFDYYM